MLDEPSISRQWVVRRLQRALGMERRHASLWNGLAGRIEAPWDAALRRNAAAAKERAAIVSDIIVALGSVPYPAFRISRLLCVTAGRFLGLLSRRAVLFASSRISAHALAEYTALTALVDGALGVPETLLTDVEPLLAAVTSEMATLQEISGGNSLPTAE